jgi:hypothetical protein
VTNPIVATVRRQSEGRGMLQRIGPSGAGCSHRSRDQTDSPIVAPARRQSRRHTRRDVHSGRPGKCALFYSQPDLAAVGVGHGRVGWREIFGDSASAILALGGFRLKVNILGGRREPNPLSMPAFHNGHM